MTKDQKEWGKAVGVWLDGARGIYIGKEIQAEAKAKGWDGDEAGPDDDDYNEATDEAEEFLNDEVVPEGFLFGYSDAGDWGLWRTRDFDLHTWFERGRAHVELRDSNTDETIIEWWDDDVSEAVEDGFLDPKDYEGSATRHAEEHGYLDEYWPDQ